MNIIHTSKIAEAIERGEVILIYSTIAARDALQVALKEAGCIWNDGSSLDNLSLIRANLPQGVRVCEGRKMLRGKADYYLENSGGFKGVPIYRVVL
jgi:hypothetical protein